jgi:hypothetical protein
MPFKEGRTLVGYGVVRVAPSVWHFAGLFQSKTEADAKAADFGEGYEVHYGEQQEGTDNFVWTRT